MKEDNFIKIRSDRHSEVSTNIVVDGKKYLILTEELEPGGELVTTRVYLGGKILLTKTLDLRDMRNSGERLRQEKVLELVRGHHERIAETIRNEDRKKLKSPSDYLMEVKSLLQRKNNKRALELLTSALEQYPSEPFLLSYYGCLEAVINKKHAYGIDICLRAIELLSGRMSFGQEIFYPTFYLNLGRAYLAAKNRKAAVNAFQTGLSFDKENRDLLWEMNKLGLRRNLPLPSLRRSHPINKYIGMILYQLKKMNT